MATEAASGPGRILTGADVTRDVEDRPDVCVVGSGAGGAVTAARLAALGARVVVLEEGPWHKPSDSTLLERDAYPRLYQEKGQRATDDLSISILQGRAIGGSTAVNWTTSFRTPDRVLEHWRRVHGIEGLGPADLAPHFAAVEERLGIHEQPADEVNANNGALWEGAGKLGWERARTRRNVQGCQNLGAAAVIGAPGNDAGVFDSGRDTQIGVIERCHYRLCQGGGRGRVHQQPVHPRLDPLAHRFDIPHHREAAASHGLQEGIGGTVMQAG